MNLSDQIRVEAINGQYGPYIKMTKTSEKRRCWLNFNTSVIEKMIESTDEINSALKNQEETTIKLNQKIEVEVKKFKDKMYVCFLVITEKGAIRYFNRINLNCSEWENFVKNMKQIKNPFSTKRAPPKMHAKTAKRQRKSEDIIIDEVNTYIWTDSTGSWYRAFYTETDCLNHHLIHGNKDEEPIIISVVAPFPTRDVWLREIVIFLLNENIQQIAKNNCEACRIDDPSQFHHTNGCLNLSETIVDLYFEQACEEIQPEAIAAFLSDVMSHCLRKDEVKTDDETITEIIQAIKKEDILEMDSHDMFHQTFNIVRFEHSSAF